MARLEEIPYGNPFIFEDSSFTLPDFGEKHVDTLVSGATLMVGGQTTGVRVFVNVTDPGASGVVVADVDLQKERTAAGPVRENAPLTANVTDVTSQSVVLIAAESPKIGLSRGGVVYVSHSVESGSLEGASPVSPFEELDQRQGNEQKIRNLIAYVRSSLDIPYREQLADRLKFLLEVTKEEAPEELEQFPESLRNFVVFLRTAPLLKYPDVVVSPSGNIRTQWQAALNKHFAAEFLPTDQAAFVVFSPYQKGTKRVSGIVPISELLEAVKPQNVLSWASE